MQWCGHYRLKSMTLWHWSHKRKSFAWRHHGFVFVAMFEASSFFSVNISLNGNDWQISFLLGTSTNLFHFVHISRLQVSFSDCNNSDLKIAYLELVYLKGYNNQECFPSWLHPSYGVPFFPVDNSDFVIYYVLLTEGPQHKRLAFQYVPGKLWENPVGRCPLSQKQRVMQWSLIGALIYLCTYIAFKELP